MRSPRHFSDDRDMSVDPRQPGYRWYHAVAVGVAANVPSVAVGGAMGDRAYYESLRRPRGAPPDWAFAPVWLGLNALALWAGLRLANASVQTPGRRQALALEGTFWSLFAAFAPLYFGLRSPILGAADTVLSAAVTAGSVAQAARVDLPAAAAIAPRLAWLLLASYVSTYMAVHNDDPRFGYRAPSHAR
jgi:benzodiazapine receptor